jgi:hypothetical protein
MKPQRARTVDSLDAAIAQVGLDERPGDRLRHGEQPLRRFRRSGRGRCVRGLWGSARFRARQTEEASCLVEDVAKVDETAALADNVEEIAVFASRGVGPMPCGATSAGGPGEADEEAAAWMVVHVAHKPVVAASAALREIRFADRLGVLGKAGGEVRRVAFHGCAPGGIVGDARVPVGCPARAGGSASGFGRSPCR